MELESYTYGFLWIFVHCMGVQKRMTMDFQLVLTKINSTIEWKDTYIGGYILFALTSGCTYCDKNDQDDTAY